MALRGFWTATALAGSALVLIACGHDHVTTAAAGLGPSFGLFYNDQGSTVSLAYGQANSDDVALMLQCAKHSGKVDVTDTVRGPGGKTLVLASAGRTSQLAAKLQASESDAPLLLLAHADLADGALQGFRRSGRINVAYGSVRYGLQASGGERAGLAQFFSACARA